MVAYYNCMDEPCHGCGEQGCWADDMDYDYMEAEPCQGCGEQGCDFDCANLLCPSDPCYGCSWHVS